jgi:hypothetical protein
MIASLTREKSQINGSKLHEMETKIVQQQIRPRSRARRAVYAAVGFVFVAIPMVLIGFFLAMSGGALGIFMMWLGNALAVIAGVMFLIGGISGARRKKLSIAACVMSVLVSGISVFGGVAQIQQQIRNPMQRLAGDAISGNFSSTRIECQFGPALCTILDPHNHIRFRCGDAPASAVVDKGIRVVRFVDTAISLQSLHDKIAIGSYGINIGGWMGAHSALETRTFSVDKGGNIQPANQGL